MTWWVPERSRREEWMDRAGNSEADLAGALEDIRRVNRFLGGRRSLLAPLLASLDVAGGAGPLRVLDVGTGCADLPLAMSAAARRRGRELQVVAVDLDPATIRLAARHSAADPAIHPLRADAFALPFGDGSFDYVTVSMFLHHFAHEDVIRLLGRFRRLARRAVIVNDLRRHRIPWGFIALVGRLTRRHPMFVHDAPLSVLRGFTDGELLDAARRSGARRPSLRRRWPFRLVLTLQVGP